MNSAAKGNSAEVFVAKDLESKGFVVGSRRHIGGAGDLLAIRGDGLTYLVEVKARKNPYEGFRVGDREAMMAVTLPVGGSRWLAAVKGSGQNRTISWVHEKEWPKSKSTPS